MGKRPRSGEVVHNGWSMSVTVDAYLNDKSASPLVSCLKLVIPIAHSAPIFTQGKGATWSVSGMS